MDSEVSDEPRWIPMSVDDFILMKNYSDRIHTTKSKSIIVVTFDSIAARARIADGLREIEIVRCDNSHGPLRFTRIDSPFMDMLAENAKANRSEETKNAAKHMKQMLSLFNEFELSHG